MSRGYLEIVHSDLLPEEEGVFRLRVYHNRANTSQFTPSSHSVRRLQTTRVEYRLSTVSTAFSARSRFIDWYAVDPDGWIKPGQTVSDPHNHGLRNGFWVYYFETEDGRLFVTSAPLPELETEK